MSDPAAVPRRVFVDTNILVYAFDTFPGSAEKRSRARDVLADMSLDLRVSAQVLSEFFVTVTRKLPDPLPHRDAAAAVGDLMLLGVVPTDADLVAAAIAVVETSQVSYWDALIVAAAERAGCARLLTEDLQHGAVLRGVRVENPFAT